MRTRAVWAAVWHAMSGDLTSASSLPIHRELTQTNFSRTINVPSTPCDACVLRVRYVSNNPLEDPQGHGPTFCTL